MKKKKSANTALNTTVMTDVLFILLIFFVLVSTVKKDTIDIKAAKVEKQPQQKSQQKTEEHVVTIDAKNQIFLDGKAIQELQELSGAFDQIKQKIPDGTTPAILLRPDAGSNSATLIDIFSALNKVGLTENVQIEVDSK